MNVERMHLGALIKSCCERFEIDENLWFTYSPSREKSIASMASGEDDQTSDASVRVIVDDHRRSLPAAQLRNSLISYIGSKTVTGYRLYLLPSNDRQRAAVTLVREYLETQLGA